MTNTSSNIDPANSVSVVHDLKEYGRVLAKEADDTKLNQMQRREKPCRMLSVLWIRQGADKGEPESLSPNRRDAYVVGWFFASAVATIGLTVLIGASALGVALIFGALARWQLTRSPWPIPERVWWYCWIVLMLAAVGLAVHDAHPW